MRLLKYARHKRIIKEYITLADIINVRKQGGVIIGLLYLRGK